MERITFNVGDEQLIGHLYKPENFTSALPALVFTGPYTGVKDQVTGIYAQRLAERGFITLAFDHRNFGESGGALRQHEEPQKKIDDLSAAVAYLSAREDVNEKRIGAVGICLGGSYALRFAGFDPRIRALATVAAAYVGFAPDTEKEAQAKVQWLNTYNDELNKLATGNPTWVPAVSEDGEMEVGMPGQEPFDYYGTKRSFSPHWENKITRLSSYNLAGFDSVSATDYLFDTPSLIVHGTTDAFCSPENAQRAFDRMVGIKQLKWIETTNHIELYDSQIHVDQAIESVSSWMNEHLNQ